VIIGAYNFIFAPKFHQNRGVGS